MRALKRLDTQRKRRQFRVRNRVRRSAGGRPRLSVFRSNRHLTAQVIDDVTGQTLVAVSTLEKDLYGSSYAGNCEAAAKAGEVLAKRAAEKGIQLVIFDRGRYQFHGRVAAFAEAARNGGLEF